MLNALWLCSIHLIIIIVVRYGARHEITHCYFNMEVNKEYKLLERFTADLSSLLQHNVVAVSGRLLEKGLVTKNVHDSMLTTVGVSSQNNAARLMSCVLDKVKYSSRCFYDFISVLREDAYYKDIVLKITEAHSKYFIILFLGRKEYGVI